MHGTHLARSTCCLGCCPQAYQDLLVGAVSGLKSHLEAPGNALVVDLVIAQGGVALSPSMEELLKVIAVASWVYKSKLMLTLNL